MDTRANEMPKWQCHKVVHAVKITAIVMLTDVAGCQLQHNEPCPYIDVSIDFMDHHDPKVGGYYVLYEDGYQSYSPAEAFESGYTRIEHTYVFPVVAELENGQGKE